MEPNLALEKLPLAPATAELRSQRRDLVAYIRGACDRIDQVDIHIHAFLPEPNRRERLVREAENLLRKYPEPGNRPPLFGALVGVKDIFHVDGFDTRAGSTIPSGILNGSQATAVTRLRNAGALVLGKTVTTEFALAEPGPTRNPHNLQHTPGGSSSGSAAAVASGFCPLALGSQTVGSVIRPASFCGVIGFKPTYGRIPVDGVIPLAPSLDHVGFFTQDLEGAELAASILCTFWKTKKNKSRPVIGIPEGPYLKKASEESLRVLDDAIERLTSEDYSIRRVRMFENFPDISDSMFQLVAAEMARVHLKWFGEHEEVYRPRTSETIRSGKTITSGQLATLRARQRIFWEELEAARKQNGVDLWVAPSAVGPAPKGLSRTGDRTMNVPWTYAGLPTLSLPVGTTTNGLPVGVQFIAKRSEDEYLLGQGKAIAATLG